MGWLPLPDITPYGMPVRVQWTNNGAKVTVGTKNPSVLNLEGKVTKTEENSVDPGPLCHAAGIFDLNSERGCLKYSGQPSLTLRVAPGNNDPKAPFEEYKFIGPWYENKDTGNVTIVINSYAWDPQKGRHVPTSRQQYTQPGQN